MWRYHPKKQIGVGGIHLGGKERRYLNEVIKSNRLSYGPFSQKLEKHFAELHDCRYAVFCNSGTSALHISLAALKEKYRWSDGDEVIVPAVTFVATSNIVLHNHMRPVFVDVDPKTYTINPALIEKKLSSRTRAIIPVHLLGLPCDMASLLSICQKYNLRMIEDSCETMFATYKGKKVGSFGEIGCFSTYIAHYIVTGVGGLATTNDPALAILLKSLMNHGRDAIYLNIDDDQNVEKEKLFEIVSKRFSFVYLGHSFRATELEAAIGLAQLETKDEIIRKRKKNASFFIQGLKDLEDKIQLPFIPPDRDHMFMLFPIVLRNESKKELVNFLEANDIETRDLLPLTNQPIYRRLFGDIEKEYPVAKWLNENGFYIGCHQYLQKKELVYMVETLHRYFKSP
ncbi:MAG: DegT/DnrJ/EryC1/StrS family aminotransferase [Candidatus Omnitrophica bacterium]|nr:DegT/DnrJ/EryC1/StrS family aminotransferase [Candidatus Omnitrophota bacterium]